MSFRDEILRTIERQESEDKFFLFSYVHDLSPDDPEQLHQLHKKVALLAEKIADQASTLDRLDHILAAATFLP